MKIIFYFENNWAFGSIHNALAKELFKKNIYANILDWDKKYSKEEFDYINNSCDLFVTSPICVLRLNREYNIPLNKIIAVAHGQWDILQTKKVSDFDFYSKLHNFSVISQNLKTLCRELKFSREPIVTETGIHVASFITQPSQYLKTIGYAGAIESINAHGIDIKRSWLLKEAVKDLDLNLNFNKKFNFLGMPGFYKSVDCVVMTSAEEAGGLPMMEAAAAGRLTIGTPVGYFEKHSIKGGGILLPFKEEEIIPTLKNIFLYYKNRPDEYLKKCLEIQDYAIKNYDWSNKIDKWEKLIRS